MIPWAVAVTAGFGGLLDIAATLLLAALLGGLLGFERERLGKAAGLRTHMLVALGAAIFVVAPLEAGMPRSDLGRVIQGVAAGVGFIGAGTILKIATEREIQGLTTAASLWLAAAVGLATGTGLKLVPLVGAFLAFLILRVDFRLRRTSTSASAGPDDGR